MEIEDMQRIGNEYVASLTVKQMREAITIKIKLPRFFKLRMILTVWLLKLAALVAWCSIEIEIEGEEKSEQEKKDAN